MAYRNTYPILIIVGAENYAMDILDIALNSNEQPSILGFVDDYANEVGLGMDVLGKIDEYPEIVADFQQQERFCRIVYVLGIEDPKRRAEIDLRMKSFDAQPYTLTHQSSIISQFAQIDVGAVLGHGSIVTANTSIGAHVHLGTHSSVNQGSKIAEYSSLGPGVRVCGNVTIENACKIGANSVVSNFRTLPAGSTISPGSIIN